MKSGSSDAGSWLMVYDQDNGCCRCEIGEAPVIDAAVTAYLDSGKTHDQVMHLAQIDGATYRILVSCISSWVDSTPEIRAREYEREATMKAERPAEPWKEDD